MLSLFRRVVVSAFLTAFPAMSQDVAAPSMANVDLETEEGKALVDAMEDVEAVWVDKDYHRTYSRGFQGYIKD